MSSSITDSKAFLDDFKSAGGWYDHETFGLSEFDQMGWGGIALKDIPVSLFLEVKYSSCDGAGHAHCRSSQVVALRS